MDSLWKVVVYRKYIFPLMLEDWIRQVDKKRPKISVVWRIVLSSFPVIEGGAGMEIW